MLQVPAHVQIIELKNGKKILTNSITDQVYELNNLSFDIIKIIQLNNCINRENLIYRLKENYEYQIKAEDIKTFLDTLIKRKLVGEGI